MDVATGPALTAGGMPGNRDPLGNPAAKVGLRAAWEPLGRPLVAGENHRPRLEDLTASRAQTQLPVAPRLGIQGMASSRLEKGREEKARTPPRA